MRNEVRMGAESMLTSAVLSTLVSQLLHFHVVSPYTNVPGEVSSRLIPDTVKITDRSVSSSYT